MTDQATVIDMQDPVQRKWAQLAILKSHLKLQAKGLKHSRLSMDDLLTFLEQHLHESKRVYPRSRKGCEQAVERIVMWQEEFMAEIAAKHGHPVAV